MPIEPGTLLGPYQIEAQLGAGGMGEVYQATDTRLDRRVAINVLPEHVASDPDLKQRFEREARTVAALNHPHICTLRHRNSCGINLVEGRRVFVIVLDKRQDLVEGYARDVGSLTHRGRGNREPWSSSRAGGAARL